MHPVCQCGGPAAKDVTGQAYCCLCGRLAPAIKCNPTDNTVKATEATDNVPWLWFEGS